MSTLQQLLNLGLVDIGEPDSRLEKIEAVCADLVARFRDEPALLIPSTLIALDHDANEEEPLFEEVEGLLIAKWRTLRNTHANRPRELLRSVLLSALSQIIIEIPEAAGVVSNTSAGLTRHKQTRLGKEAPIVESIIKKAQHTAESEAVRRASIVPIATESSTARNSEIDISVRVDEVDASELIQDVARAAGPQYPAGKALPDSNPQWSNTAQKWSLDFTPRMATALAKAVNLGTEKVSVSIETTLTAYLADIEKCVVEQMKSVAKLGEKLSTSANASRMRLEILWWSEALYSPTFGCGYRELPENVAAVAAALDLAAVVPPLAPASVTYLLGEVVLRSIQGGEKKPVDTYLTGLGRYPPLSGALPEVGYRGRCPLLDVVCEAVAGKVISNEKFFSRTGLTAKVSAPEFAMWVFSDLQARRLVEEL